MFRILVIAACLTAPSAALAQATQDGRIPSGPPDPHRAEGEKACSADAQQFCRPVLGQGDMAVLACFQQNRSQISRDCDSFLRKMGQ
jgi:hypothetical protein